MKFYTELVLSIIESVNNSKEVSRSGPSDVTGIPSDFLMLCVEEPTQTDILKQSFGILLHHDMIINYFLNEVNSSDETREISHIISPMIAKIVAMIPSSLDLSAYLNPFIHKISSNLDGSEELTIDFLNTVSGFVELLDSQTFGKLSSVLLDSNFINKLIKHPESSDSIRKQMMNILQQFNSKSRLKGHDFSLDVIGKLAAAAVNSSHEQLLSILCNIIQAAPVYSLALEGATFEQLLELKTTGSDKLLSLVLSSNPYCRQLFKDWLARTHCLKRKQSRWQIINYVLYYLHGSAGRLIWNYFTFITVFRYVWSVCCLVLVISNSSRFAYLFVLSTWSYTLKYTYIKHTQV